MTKAECQYPLPLVMLNDSDLENQCDGLERKPNLEPLFLVANSVVVRAESLEVGVPVVGGRSGEHASWVVVQDGADVIDMSPTCPGKSVPDTSGTRNTCYQHPSTCRTCRRWDCDLFGSNIPGTMADPCP